MDVPVKIGNSVVLTTIDNHGVQRLAGLGTVLEKFLATIPNVSFENPCWTQEEKSHWLTAYLSIPKFLKT